MWEEIKNKKILVGVRRITPGRGSNCQQARTAVWQRLFRGLQEICNPPFSYSINSFPFIGKHFKFLTSQGFHGNWRLLSIGQTFAIHCLIWWTQVGNSIQTLFQHSRIQTNLNWNSGKNSNILSPKNADLQCLSEVIPYYFCNTITLWFYRMQKSTCSPSCFILSPRTNISNCNINVT